MSSYAKILSALVVGNLLGAAGLVYLASADYGRRAAWAQSYAVHELLLNGLPLDAQEMDSTFGAALDRYTDEDFAGLFRTALGGAFKTQAEVFTNVRGSIDGKLTATDANKVQQTFLLARILLPFANSYMEREQLLAARVHFQNDQTYQQLVGRCRLALARVPGYPNVTPKAFRDGFRVAFHSQLGEPAEFFVSLVLRNYPDDRAVAMVNFDQALDAAVEVQRAGLRQNLTAILEEASGKSPSANEPLKTPAPGSRKAAIARAMFGLAQFLAEEMIFSDSGDANDKQMLTGVNFAEYQKRLITTKTYKGLLQQAQVVVGLRSMLLAVTERTGALHRLSDYVVSSAGAERQQFVDDHNYKIDQVREQGKLAKIEQGLLTDNKERLAGYEGVVRERKAELTTLREEYGKDRAATAQKIAKLRDMSKQVLDLRQEIRDAIERTEQGETRIRQLETQVRELDRKKDN